MLNFLYLTFYGVFGCFEQTSDFNGAGRCHDQNVPFLFSRRIFTYFLKVRMSDHEHFRCKINYIYFFSHEIWNLSKFLFIFVIPNECSLFSMFLKYKISRAGFVNKLRIICKAKFAQQIKNISASYWSYTEMYPFICFLVSYMDFYLHTWILKITIFCYFNCLKPNCKV